MGAYLKPIFGFVQYPPSDFSQAHNPLMGIMQTVAANLEAWRAQHPEMDTLKKIALRAGVGFGTVQRAMKGDGNVTVQKLESIAGAFHRQAIDLLHQPAADYRIAPPPRLLSAEEPPAEERDLLVGFREASPEIRELMLDAARRAIARRDSPTRNGKSQ